jgi:cytoskeletal protein CcmA (bactofilin family)
MKQLSKKKEEYMFEDNKRKGASEGPLLTVLGSAARLEGKFTIADSIEIECEVAGEINVEGKLVVGENGIVQATVHTVDALIMGLYEGDMVATGEVEVTDTGRISGNIETDSLVISKGGFFNGNVSKLKKERKAEVAPEPRKVPMEVVEATNLGKKPATGSGVKN